MPEAMNEHVRAGDPRPFTRVGRYRGKHRLTVGDLRTILATLDRLNYPDSAEVDVITPLPLKDRRIVDLNVYDYTPIEQENKHP
jgi:hypothetical protein